jgi:hypothetical protein
MAIPKPATTNTMPAKNTARKSERLLITFLNFKLKKNAAKEMLFFEI